MNVTMNYSYIISIFSPSINKLRFKWDSRLYYLFLPLYFIVLIYQFVFFVIYSTSSSTPSIIMESQYMLFTLLFILFFSVTPVLLVQPVNTKNTSLIYPLRSFFTRDIWRSLSNYLIMNGILSSNLIIGLLSSNSVFLLFSFFGKVGCFPFFLVYSLILYTPSYSFLPYDQIIKLVYLFILLFIFSLSIYFYFTDYLPCLFNFILILVYIKFILTIKHTILISFIILFILLYYLVLNKSTLYSFLSVLRYTSFSYCSILTLFLSFIIHSALLYYHKLHLTDRN